MRTQTVEQPDRGRVKRGAGAVRSVGLGVPTRFDTDMTPKPRFPGLRIRFAEHMARGDSPGHEYPGKDPPYGRDGRYCIICSSSGSRNVRNNG